MNIDAWVRRPGKGTKWHLVESTVAGDAVTRCGRRMDRVTKGGELAVSEVMPSTRLISQRYRCRLCDPIGVIEETAAPEDDGSTAPDEDTP